MEHDRIDWRNSTKSRGLFMKAGKDEAEILLYEQIGESFWLATIPEIRAHGATWAKGCEPTLAVTKLGKQRQQVALFATRASPEQCRDPQHHSP